MGQSLFIDLVQCFHKTTILHQKFEKRGAYFQVQLKNRAKYAHVLLLLFTYRGKCERLLIRAHLVPTATSVPSSFHSIFLHWSLGTATVLE